MSKGSLNQGEGEKYFSLFYFNLLRLETKGEEVFDKGNYFDTINGVVLYHYNDFLVECLYNVDSNEIEELKGISIEDAADKYVQMEDISL